MAFSRKKQADNPPSKSKSNEINAQKPRHAAEKFMQAASDFTKSEIERVKFQNKLFLGIAGAATVAAVGMSIALAGITPLKTVEPFIVRVDNNTGLTDVVATRKNQTIENEEVINKYWLAQYVRYRESYDWQTIQSTYDATRLLSSEDEKARFAAIYEKPNAPDKFFGANYRVKVKIRNISFVGDTAQVRFTKTLAPTVPQNSGVTTVENLIATIAFDYKNTPDKEENFLVNPLGFQVLSYRTDPEVLP